MTGRATSRARLAIASSVLHVTPEGRREGDNPGIWKWKLAWKTCRCSGVDAWLGPITSSEGRSKSYRQLSYHRRRWAFQLPAPPAARNHRPTPVQSDGDHQGVEDPLPPIARTPPHIVAWCYCRGSSPSSPPPPPPLAALSLITSTRVIYHHTTTILPPFPPVHPSPICD